MIKFYLDLGSSTVKVYKFEDNLLELVSEKSIYLKNGFSAEQGFSESNVKELLDFLRTEKDKRDFKVSNTFLFATGIYRELGGEAREKLVETIAEQTGLFLNIISHGLENYYFGEAMIGDYNNLKTLMVNMGGKTTELITFENNKITKRENVKIGVASIMNAFPGQIENISSAKYDDMLEFAKGILRDVKFDKGYQVGIFTGGELRLHKIVGSDLEENNLFNDGIHFEKVSMQNFDKFNRKITHEMTMEELYGRLPSNPKWMDGARAGAALGQAIFELANIDTIIPSDLNLINGVIKDTNK